MVQRDGTFHIQTTNYRHGEDIYLYHTTATPEQARGRFLEYLRSISQIHDHPRW